MFPAVVPTDRTRFAYACGIAVVWRIGLVNEISALSSGAFVFCADPALNLSMHTALASVGSFSVLPRAIVNGEEPFATLFAQRAPAPQRGRPRGSGTYATSEAFLAAVRPILGTLKQEGCYPSEERVAQMLLGSNADPARQLRVWLRRFNLAWDTVVHEGEGG